MKEFWRELHWPRFGGRVALTIASLIVLVFFVAGDLITLRSSQASLEGERQAYDASQLVNAVDLAESSLLAAESANRAYSLTGDERYAIAYDKAKEDLRLNLEAAEKGIHGTKQDPSSFDRINTPIQAELAEMDSLINTRRDYGLDRVIGLMAAGSGIEYSRQARQSIDELRRSAKFTLDAKDSDASGLAGASSAAFIAVSIVGIALLGMLYWLVLRAHDEHVKRQNAERLHREALQGEVTSRKAAEALVRSLNDTLERRVQERTAKLVEAHREMEGFCYSVSHDLRTPLRTIDAASAILLEEYADGLPGDARRQLDRQARAARRMDLLIDDLLQFVRLREAPMGSLPVDLSKLTSEVATQMGVDADVQEGMYVVGDAAFLRIMLTNLLDNARKFSGGAPPRVKVGQNEGVWYMRDNGQGFDMAYVHKLFEPFQRLHGDEVPGTGIGLATVKRIVERHGGRVWAASRPGEGATFFVRFEQMESRRASAALC